MAGSGWPELLTESQRLRHGDRLIGSHSDFLKGGQSESQFSTSRAEIGKQNGSRQHLLANLLMCLNRFRSGAVVTESVLEVFE